MILTDEFDVAKYAILAGDVKDVEGRYCAHSTYVQHKRARVRGRKVLIRTWNISTDATEAIIEEYRKAIARVLRKWERVVPHPHIAEFCGILEDGISLPAFVRPMYPYSANQYLEARPCAQIAPILRDVADALEFMHGQTPVVVHGNIRAANVLIRDNGRAVLADIGMNASDLTQMPHRLPASYRSIAIGQQWLAPEIIMSGMKLRASTQADVYSFGMMSCELYTGGPPYGYNKNVFDMAEICKNSLERPKRPKDYRLTDYMWQIICNCWQSDPRGRPRIQEVSLQLENGIKLGWVG